MIPDRFAAAGLDKLEVFAEGLDHPEGIVIQPDGTIHVGGELGQVYEVSMDGGHREIANTGGMVLGFAADAAGRLYVCNEGRGKVFRVSPSSGATEIFAEGVEGRPMRCPNWPAFDAAGNLYVSDSGEWGDGDGLIWVVRPGGRLEVWSEESCDFPNGLALAPDGSRLFAVESNPGRIVEIPIDDDGSAGRRRVLYEFGTAVVPDGVAVAADGALIVACYRPDAIYRWSAGDGLEAVASDPQGVLLCAPANVAFAGEELEILVAPNLAAHHLVRGALGVRGTPLFRPSAEAVDG